MNLRPIVAGIPMALTCEREGSIRQEAYQGREAWFVDCRQGDRSPGDTGPVERVRLDGWPRLLPFGQPFQIDFTIQPLLGFDVLRRPTDWCVLHELHAKDMPGSGPFKIEHNRHSDGTMRFEANVQQPIFDASGKMIGTRPTFYPLGDFRQGNRYVFRVEGLTGPAGYLRLFLCGRQVVNHRGPFGYGTAPLYPQFGIYRSSQSLRQQARFMIDQCGTVAAKVA